MFRSFFSWIFFFYNGVWKHEGKHHGTLGFFFLGGGVPAVTGIWYQLFMSDSLTNKQRSPASLLSTQHLSDSLLAGKKKKKNPKNIFVSSLSQIKHSPCMRTFSYSHTIFFPFHTSTTSARSESALPPAFANSKHLFFVSARLYTVKTSQLQMS